MKEIFNLCSCNKTLYLMCKNASLFVWYFLSGAMKLVKQLHLSRELKDASLFLHTRSGKRTAHVDDSCNKIAELFTYL